MNETELVLAAKFEAIIHIWMNGSGG